MFKIFLEGSSLYLSKFKLVYFICFLAYLLPFSFINFNFLPIYRIPYTYLIFFIFSFSFFLKKNSINLNINKKLFILFFFSSLLMLFSYFLNENYSSGSILGTILRLICIIQATFFVIDIRLLFKHLIYSIPLYLIPLLFTQKIGLYNSITANSNTLGASFVSIVFLVFLLKAKFKLTISKINYLLIFLCSSIILVITESRGLLLSLLCSFLIVCIFIFFRKLFSNLTISKNFLKLFFSSSLISVILFFLIFNFNSSNENFLLRYPFLNRQNSEEISLEMYIGDIKRLYLFNYAIDGIRQKPFLGHGSGNNQEVYKNIREFNFIDKRKSLHNIYLTIAYQFGIPCLLFLILFFKTSLSINYKNKNPLTFLFLINFIFLIGFFTDSLAKNFFVLLFVILSVGYRKNKVN